MHIGGVQIARGYLGRPELTAEKFVPNPFGAGRLYKTGDLARYRDDGVIEYLGRLDHQVKIRGFRIELEEIESVLGRHPAVRQCVVVGREDRPGEKRLVAYYVPTQKPPTSQELTTVLLAKLPDYMVPTAFVALDSLPLTPSGKIDRRSLPAPALPTAGETASEPRTPVEEKLSTIWTQVLGLPHIGVEANFFEMGGDSLSALRIVNQIREYLGEHVSLVVMFEAPTIAGLAALLEANYADAIARQTGGGKAAEDLSGRIDSAKIEIMRRIVGKVPPALPLNGAGKNPRAIFILSPMRSGSTLFRIMLAGHPELFSPPELQLLMFNTLAERAEAFGGGYNRYLTEGTIRAVMEIKRCGMEEAQEVMRECERAGWSVPQVLPADAGVDRSADAGGQDAGLRNGYRGAAARGTLF